MSLVVYIIVSKCYIGGQTILSDYVLTQGKSLHYPFEVFNYGSTYNESYSFVMIIDNVCFDLYKVCSYFPFF